MPLAVSLDITSLPLKQTGKAAEEEGMQKAVFFKLSMFHSLQQPDMTL